MWGSLVFLKTKFSLNNSDMPIEWNTIQTLKMMLQYMPCCDTICVLSYVILFK